jgi:hypothetical protein
MTTTEITYSPETNDYTCFIDGECIGFTKSHVAGEILINQKLGNHPVVAQNIGMQIAQLAVQYGKETSEASRKAIKTEAKRLMAIRDGIEYSVFEQGYQEYRAQQRAA